MTRTYRDRARTALVERRTRTIGRLLSISARGDASDRRANSFVRLSDRALARSEARWRLWRLRLSALEVSRSVSQFKLAPPDSRQSKRIVTKQYHLAYKYTYSLFIWR